MSAECTLKAMNPFNRKKYWTLCPVFLPKFSPGIGLYVVSLRSPQPLRNFAKKTQDTEVAESPNIQSAIEANDNL
jgi:hypothetical protein